MVLTYPLSMFYELFQVIFVKIMNYFYLILITCFNSSTLNAIFTFPDKFNLKNYSLASTKVQSLPSSKFKRKIEGFFNLTISNDAYRVFVKTTRIPHLYSSKSEVIVLNGNRTTKKKFSNYGWNIVKGFVEDNLNCSGVDGYIIHGEFYGTIILKNRIYYVEDVNKFSTLLSSQMDRNEYNAIVYDQESLLGENREGPFERFARSSNHIELLMSEEGSKIIYKDFIADRHICPLLVVLDNSFLKQIHKNDVTSAVAQAMVSINDVNSVFRSHDFDGDGIPDNIGFIIKYLVVIENEDTPFNYLPTYSKQPASPRYYLAHFAQYLILREVCLGIIFTAQPFQENVLGVSYSAVSESDISNDIIGGICQRPFTSYLLSLNAVAVSYVSTHGMHLPQGTLDTCLTHEIGHAFGCRHDRSSDPGYNEEYIMSSHTLPGKTLRNFQFSPISKKHLVMTVPKKGHCLLKSTEPFCGNGISEQGEECDCGAKYVCQSTDSCCIPSGLNGACQINRAAGHDCHPSQGFCCSLDCKYERLEKHGVECQLLNRTCPCEDVNCECGIGGRCLGMECQSEECVRIDAEECDCPYVSVVDSCNVCCLVNSGGACLSSRNLTQWKLDLGLITIKQLERFDALRTLPNATSFEKFCHGIDCITLAFKKSKFGEYCLKNGKLGKCSPFGCGLRETKIFEAEKQARNIEMVMSSVCTFPEKRYSLNLLFSLILLNILK